MLHPELKCSVCGYVPDDKDIEKTNYRLGTCETCGQENVCDLCLGYGVEKRDGKWDLISGSECPLCSGRKPWGKKRKRLLKDEY